MLDISKHTLRTNTSYHYEDCPWREQALWVFDMRVMALINYYFYGDYKLVAKNIRQCFALQEEDGALNSTGPKKNSCYHFDFCMHLIAVVKEYYQYSGDRDLLLELLPYIGKLAGFIAGFQDGGLLDSTIEERGEPFLDWSTDIDKPGKSIILNAIYSNYLKDIAFIYGVCGENSEKYSADIEPLRKGVNQLLFDSDAGLYRDSFFEGKLSEKYSLQGNMAAVYGGFADEKRVAEIVRKISDKQKFHPPFAPSFYLIIFEALSVAGRYDLIADYIDWYWGAMLQRGATTWWEVFDPNTPGWAYPHPYLGNVPTYEMDWIPVSTCHGWSGVCAYSIPKYIFGIDLLRLYENKITIKPGIKDFSEKFSYKVPIKNDYLHIVYEGKSIDVVHCPDDINLIVEK